MKVLEGECPSCHGNLVVDFDEGTLTCEDCDFVDVHKGKIGRKLALELEEKCVEYGDKDKRLKPSIIGKLFLKPYDGLSEYLRTTLEEAVRGGDMEDYELDQLNKYGLLDNGGEDNGTTRLGEEKGIT